MGIAPPALVVGAARQPLPYGLFSVMPLRTGDRWESGVQWETGTCDPAGGIGEWKPELSEVQTITVTGTPTGGTFTLTYGGQKTASINYNDSAATVQTRLRALSTIGGTNVTVTGGPGPGTPWVVTFAPGFPDAGDAGPITVTDKAFTGGTSPDATVAETVKGTSTLGLPKTLDANLEGTETASAFTVYGHFTCSPVGWSQAAAQDMATAHLVAREEGRVEQAFWTGDLNNDPKLRGATILGGGAVGMARGLALLEEEIAKDYGSLGVIHMTRGTATIYAAMQMLTTSGSRLTTILGTPVVAGGGYDNTSPDGTAAGAGKAWIYSTPAMFGYRTEPFTGSNAGGDLFDRRQNLMYAVTERTYLLGFDPCGVHAAEVTLWTT